MLFRSDNSTGGMGKGGGAMIAMPTFYFEFDKDDQRRDVSICNYGLKLSTIGKLYILAVGNKNDFIRFIWNTFIADFIRCQI